MLDQKIRGLWDQVMSPVGRGLARTGLSANAITAIGLLIQAYAGYLIVTGAFLSAGLVTIAAALADGLDGAVAKAKGTESKFGALWDSTADRIGEAFYYLPIAWVYGFYPFQISGYTVAHSAEVFSTWVSALALVTLVAAFLVSYVRARAESLGFECKVGLAERAERMILLIFGLVFDALPLVMIILSIVTVVTFLQRVIHVRKQAVAGG